MKKLKTTEYTESHGVLRRFCPFPPCNSVYSVVKSSKVEWLDLYFIKEIVNG